MMINNEVEKPDDATLILRRTLNAPAELVFKAWTSPEDIKEWMRPNPGMKVQSARMDLKVGGKIRIQMKNPDGEFFTGVGEFREVKAPEKLVYTWDWEKDGSEPDEGEPEGKTTLMTVEFLKRGKQTELVLTHTRFATVESRNNHAEGWGKCVDAFAAFLEKK